MGYQEYEREMHMLNFEYRLPTKMVYGRDTHKQVGELLRPYGKKALIHYGGGSIIKSGLLDEVREALEVAGVEYVELGGVKPNPKLSKVYEGIDLCRKENVEVILAVGGGSVIDSAKAIGAGVHYEGDVWELFLSGEFVDKKIPVATVLTIPAAGSEVSTGSVISNEETNMKICYDNPIMGLVVSVINPELFFTLPHRQIANGAADMISHLFERYFTNTLYTDVTDGIAEATIKVIMKQAIILRDQPQNYDAWFEFGFAGGIAHNNLTGLGREQDWASHLMEHELSGFYDVDHGAGLAVITPAWMRYVYKDNIPMFVQFAMNVMGVEPGGRSDEYIIHEGIRRLEVFYSEMGLPKSLRELGIKDDSKFEEMAKQATRLSSIGGLKKLKWMDIVNIYNSCLL